MDEKLKLPQIQDDIPSIVPAMFERELTPEELAVFGERYVSNPMGVALLYRDIGTHILELQSENPNDKTINYNDMVSKALEKVAVDVTKLPQSEFLESHFCYKSGTPIDMMGNTESIVFLENIIHGANYHTNENVNEEWTSNITTTSVQLSVSALYRRIIQKNISEILNVKNAQVPLLYDVFHVASRQTSPTRTKIIIENIVENISDNELFHAQFESELSKRASLAVLEINELLHNIPTTITLVPKRVEKLIGGDNLAREFPVEVGVETTVEGRKNRGKKISLRELKREAMSRLNDQVTSMELTLENFMLVDGLDTFSHFALAYWKDKSQVPNGVDSILTSISMIEGNSIATAISEIDFGTKPISMEINIFISMLEFSFNNQRRALHRDQGIFIEQNELIDYLTTTTRNPLARHIHWGITRRIREPTWTIGLTKWLNNVDKDITSDPRSDPSILATCVQETTDLEKISKQFIDEFTNNTTSLWEHGDGFKAQNHTELKALGLSEVVFYPNWEPLSNGESYKASLTLQTGEQIEILFTLEGMFYYLDGDQYKRVFIPHIAGTRILKTFTELLSQVLRIHTAENPSPPGSPTESEAKPRNKDIITEVTGHISRLPEGHNADMNRIKSQGNYPRYLSLYTQGLATGRVDPNARYTYTNTYVRNQPGDTTVHEKIRYH